MADAVRAEIGSISLQAVYDGTYGSWSSNRPRVHLEPGAARANLKVKVTRTGD